MTGFSEEDRLFWQAVNRGTKALKNKRTTPKFAVSGAEASLRKMANKGGTGTPEATGTHDSPRSPTNSQTFCEDGIESYRPDYARQINQQLNNARIISNCTKALMAASAARTGGGEPQRSMPKRFGLTKLSNKKIKKGDIVAELDLHGYTLIQAEYAIRDFLYKNYMLGTTFVKIITGKSGVLCSRTPEFLRKYAKFASGYTHARRDDGDGGALYVRIRRQRSPGL
ncbi:MAG: Smr/MutS family protein [Holosporales bacterium]|nr:Smr/MutS family protein [Holosporales bacterium]